MKKKRKLCFGDKATVLTVFSCVGLVTTVITAVRVTSKVTRLLDKAEQEKGEKLAKSEIIKVTGSAYVPTVLIGTATIACILGANVLNKRCQQSLVSAYALLNQSFQEYRKKLIELHGEETDVEVRTAIAREHCNFHQFNLDVPDKKLVFYEPMSERTITRYEREIMDAEYHLNRNFVLRGWVSLNEFYAFLGMEKTDLGDRLGWSIEDGYYWIDFDHVPIEAEDGSRDTWYCIDTYFVPDEDYNWEER